MTLNSLRFKFQVYMQRWSLYWLIFAVIQLAHRSAVKLTGQ